MRKKTILAVVTLLSVAVSTVGISLLATSPDIKIGATDNYSCELPTGYVEIADVIDYALSYSSVNNPYTFRGTVTKVKGNEAYLQRVNQNTFKLDAIKLYGIQDQSISIAPGNVLDIEGGMLKRPNGSQVEYWFTNTSVYNVAFDENPTGYDARPYASYDEFFYGEMGENLNNGLSRYISLGNAKFNGYTTVTIDETDYTVIILQDLFDNELFDCLLNMSASDADEVLATLDDLLSNAHAVKINCIWTYTLSYNNPYFVIFDKTDIFDGGSFLDNNVISSLRTSAFVWATNGYNYFPYYTMVGKDEYISYVEFAEFYYNAMSTFVLNSAYARLTKCTFTNPGWENKVGFFMSATHDVTLFVIADPVEDTITIQNDYWGIFSSFYPIGGSPKYISNGGETAYCEVTNATTVLDNPSSITFDLGAYGIDIIKDKYDNIYVPLTVLGDIILNTRNIGMGWNGRYYFYLNNTIADGTLLSWYLFDTPYSYYDSESGHQIVYPTRTQEFADFTYNEFCFALEHYYGLRNYKIPQSSSADAIITASGYKTDLLSTDVATYEEAMCNFVTTWVGDGHARFSWPSPYAGENYQYYRDLGNDFSNGRNPRMQKLFDDFDEIDAVRTAAAKGVGLEISDNLAIIRFDKFVKYSGGDSKDYDLTQDYATVHDAGSDLLFRKAFNEIEANPNIVNVVIDLTDNGGGALNSIPFLEAYLVSDPSVTCHDSLTGQTVETHYSLDLDYDGVFGDTYAGDYNFFILTSNASFSCGNYFPTVMKEKGVTIIGETSGGGECAVAMFATADGTIIRDSSNMHLGHYDYVNNVFVGNDAGVTPDYAYPRAKFYDTEYLKDFLNDLIA